MAARFWWGKRVLKESGDSEYRECPHRKRAKAFHLYRHREEPKILGGKLLQSGHMLHNRDVVTEQRGMHGPKLVSRIINIVGINAHQCCSALHQKFGCASGQERMSVEVI